MSDHDDIERLRQELAECLADALRAEDETRADSERLQHLHDDELALARHFRDDDVANFEQALASRDVIGQAKGITMVALQCTADQAFDLLRRQSQHQNRKLVEIATEIADRVSRRAKLT
jgi:hypothetical protein